MTLHRLICNMHPEPAAIERICQVVRVRGFQVEQLRVRRQTNRLEIELEVTGERALPMLLTQIDKLHTVTGVWEEASERQQQAC